MVATYKVFGVQVGSHYLAIATLSSLFGGSYLALRKGSTTKPTTPPINASSKDEELFIQEFLKNVDAEDKKAKA